MKKVTATLTFLFLFIAGNVVFAQQYQQESDLIKSIVGKAKKDFVTDNIDIPETTANTFWMYYNAYEIKRQELGEQRVNLLTRYVDLYNSNDATAYKDLVTDIISLKKRSENNLKKYYKKMVKEVSPKTAMQFFQIEEFIRSTTESELYGNLPMVN